MVLLVFSFGCAELFDGATKQVFVDATLTLDGVSEGRARDRIATLADAGWLNAADVGIAAATRFKSALADAVADGTLSDEELARLEDLAETFDATTAETHAGELLEKRQAEAERRKIRSAAMAELRIDGTDVWPSAGTLAERGTAVGWTVHDCARRAETGYLVQTCRFTDEAELVEVGFTVFAQRADARLAAVPAPWERGAVAFRKGRKVLKVRSTDRTEAERITTGLLTEETRQGPIELTAFQASLVALGYRVDACRSDVDAYGTQLSCDVRRPDAGGWVQLAWPTGEPLRPDAEPTYPSSTSHVDLEGLVARAQIHTTAASAPRLAGFRKPTDP